MMPHAIRRVYVARRARTAASIVVCIAGAAMLVAGASPQLAHLLARGMPGINPAVLSTFVVAMWIAGLFAYAVARALDEHRFAVAMSHFVLPSKDVDHDIERLSHEHPDEAARDMAHRLEARSAALPVLAASMLLPVSALFRAQAVRAHGWPAIADFETSLAIHTKALITSAIVGVVVAIVMTRQFARRPAMLPSAAALAVATGIGAVVAWSWLVTPMLLAMTIAIVVRKLGRERTLLAAKDPAAGSEVFTLRGLLRQLRTTASHVKGPRGRLAVATLAVAAAGFYPTHGKPIEQATATVVQITPPHTPVANPAGSRYSVENLGDGMLLYTIELANDQALEIKDIETLASVPPHWSAHLGVEIVTSAGTLAVKVDDNQGATFPPDGAVQQAKFVVSSCGVALHAMGMRVQGPAGKYVLRVHPMLEPAGC